MYYTLSARRPSRLSPGSLYGSLFRRTMVSLRRAARIILIGAPGVGKGTQSVRLIKQYPDLSALAAGDLVRAAVRQKTSIGLAAEKTMKEGGLIPDASIISLIVAEMRNRQWIAPSRNGNVSHSGSASVAKGSMADALEYGTAVSENSVSDHPAASFILDGFPRTAAQAEKLDSLIPINFVVHLVTPVDIILERIADRWVHEPSGRVYNTGYNPPKVPGRDDSTGEKLVQREDDSEETWRARLKKFDETSKGLLEHYDKKGVLWKVEGNSSDEISPKLLTEVGRRFVEV